MKKIILYDNEQVWQNLLPLTFTRSVAECRIGIITIKEKWEAYLNSTIDIEYCIDYLKNELDTSIVDLKIASHILPTPELIVYINSLEENTIISYQGVEIISYKVAPSPTHLDYPYSLNSIQYPWDIFLQNDRELRSDFTLLTQNRESQAIDKNSILIGDAIFIEKGANISCAILNTTSGPIYIGKDAEIMEGALIKGPFALGQEAQVKMGAKIYGPTTIGPYCKVGGEVTNSILFGYSNKAHDGYIGNSVIGEWCNLGADSNSSNLKNNYSKVEVYNYLEDTYISTDQQFCGLIMGDYSKCAINTMFNTGTVVGVCANIFGGGFPSKHIPSFSWYSISKNEMYQIDKALQTIKIVCQRRNITLSLRQENMLRKLYETLKLPISN